jgi:O-antigen ligase
MDLSAKGKSFNLLLLGYFVLLPFVFFGSILDAFLLARQLLTAVLLFSFLAFLILKSKNSASFKFDKSALFFLGFLVFCVYSFSNSQIVDLSHTTLSKYLVFFLFFILIRHLILNDLIAVDQLKSYIILFGLLSIIITVLAFANKSINGQTVFRKVNAISGTFGNKNFLSSILFFCLPFYFIGISISKKIKVVSVAAIVSTIILLLLLRTRTVLIALSLFLFFVLLLQIKNKLTKKTRNRLLLSLALLLIVGIGCLYLFAGKLHSSQYFHSLLYSGTFLERLEFWQQALYAIKDNFFSGIGVGNWISTYPKYGLHHFSDTEIVNGRMIVSNPHNDFLLVFSEIGLFGFLCYVGIFICMLYQGYWLSKNETNSIDRKHAAYFLFFIICYLIIAFFDFPLTRIEHQILLLTVFAIISAKYLKANSTTGFKIAPRLIYGFSFVLLLYSTTILLYRVNGEKHLVTALEAEKIADNDTVILEMARAKNAFFSTDNYAIPLDWHIGKAQYNLGNFNESMSRFIAAYKLNPYNLVVNNDLGSTYIKNYNIEVGIKHYKEALAISPNYEDARINLAATYFNAKQYEMAFETIDQCDINSKNINYKQILAPIVEQKLNSTLIKINNPDLNNHLKRKITSVAALIDLYFDSKRNNSTFDNYILSLTH